MDITRDGVWDVEDYRRRLLAAFPPRPFHGLVSTHDECDDGIHLRTELAGKRWDELSPEVIFHGSIALCLMEPPALVAFLAAWLYRAMAVFDPKSVGLEFTVYFLCPGETDDGDSWTWESERLARRVALFEPAQQALVREFLQRIVASGEMKWFHPEARFGLEWWGAETSKAP